MVKAHYGFPGNGVQSTIYWDRPKLDIPENQDFLDYMNQLAECDLVGKMFDKKERKNIVDEVEIQVSIVGSSYLLSKQLEEKIECEGAFGLSLGEVTAAGFTESIRDPYELLEFTKKRAQAMIQCVPTKDIVTLDDICEEKAGKYMASVSGLRYKIIDKVCNHVTKKQKYGSVIAANENTPKQTVMSGAEKAVERAAKILKRKYKDKIKITFLKTGGPWHNPDYMSDAAGFVRSVLDDMNIQRPKTDLWLSGSRKFVSDPGEIKDNLAGAIPKPFKLWSSIMDLLKTGCKRLVDVGAGGILNKFYKEVPGAEIIEKDKI